MKKYLWLAAAAAASVGLILMGARSLRKEPIPVRITPVKFEQVEQTVRCTGRVEPAAGETPAFAGAGEAVLVRVAVPESRLRRVAVGQQVRVSGDAFSAEWYRGRVAALASSAYVTPSGGTAVDAFITLEGTDDSLRCGLTARADICVSTVFGMLLPYSCLLADDRGEEYVWIEEKGRAARRYVTVLEETASGALITGGVEEGDRLITDPSDSLKEGDPVREAGA